MAFSRSQRGIALGGLCLLAGMALCPPWSVDSGPRLIYSWLWSPPGGVLEHPRVQWFVLAREQFVAAAGMVMLLFLRERDERRRPPACMADEIAAIF